jgi:hypothetical protein
MSTFQTLLALVVLIFVLSVMVQAVQEVFKSLSDSNDITTAKTTLWVGVFVLLALPVVQGQTANPTPPAADKKTEKKGTTDKKGAGKKTAEATADKKAADKKTTSEAVPVTPQTQGGATTAGPWHVSVDAVASDQLSLDVLSLYPSKTDKTTTIPGTACTNQDLPCKRLHLVVTDSVVKDRLKQLHKDDHIQIVYSTDSTKNQNVLKALSIDAVPPPTPARVWVMLGSTVAGLLLYCIFSGFRPQQLIIGEDNRYSNSKFQIALWFFVLIATYIATLWLRVWSAGWDFVGGVDIPKNLLLLSGLSALTFGGAKGITSSKAAAAPALKTAADKPNFFFDLTHNDQKQFDFGDFQMLVVTLIAVATYCVLIFNFLGTIEYSKAVSLPDVDTTILATFGLGQGAYLTKKAVGEVGKS